VKVKETLGKIKTNIFKRERERERKQNIKIK
jgi:hypothetical protein